MVKPKPTVRKIDGRWQRTQPVVGFAGGPDAVRVEQFASWSAAHAPRAAAPTSGGSFERTDTPDGWGGGDWPPIAR